MSLDPAPGVPVGLETTTDLLRRLIPHCAGCGLSLSGHTYRFFACHPAAPGGATGPSAVHDFLAVFMRGDWAAVQSNQQPSVDEPRLMVYVVACPGAAVRHAGGGMAIALTMEEDSRARVLIQQALLTDELVEIRALCPACPWTQLNS